MMVKQMNVEKCRRLGTGWEMVGYIGDEESADKKGAGYAGAEVVDKSSKEKRAAGSNLSRR